MAKYLSPSINVLAKGAIGAAIGSSIGPIGATTGFASGALKGIYDEVSASLISSAFEENINTCVEVIVDKAASRLREADSSLGEEKSRAIALSFVVAASSASEFLGVRANVLKAATSIGGGINGGVRGGIKASGGGILDEKNGIGKYISAFEGDSGKGNGSGVEGRVRIDLDGISGRQELKLNDLVVRGRNGRIKKIKWVQDHHIFPHNSQKPPFMTLKSLLSFFMDSLCFYTC